jgi:hypothetical protein
MVDEREDTKHGEVNPAARKDAPHGVDDPAGRGPVPAATDPSAEPEVKPVQGKTLNPRNSGGIAE